MLTTIKGLPFIINFNKKKKKFEKDGQVNRMVGACMEES